MANNIINSNIKNEKDIICTSGREKIFENFAKCMVKHLTVVGNVW